MNKQKWHKCATAMMVRVARELGIETCDRKIRSNKGGNAVGGEVTMSAPKFGVYVHLTCPVNSYGESELPYAANYMRRCTPDDPYGTGMDKPNHHFPTYTPAELVTLCKKIGGKS